MDIVNRIDALVIQAIATAGHADDVDHHVFMWVNASPFGSQVVVGVKLMMRSYVIGQWIDHALAYVTDLHPDEQAVTGMVHDAIGNLVQMRDSQTKATLDMPRLGLN